MRYLYCLFLAWPLAGCDLQPDVQASTADVAVHLWAAPGRIEGARRTIDLAYPGTALVGETLVREGERVERGQVLIRMDCDAMKAELDSAEAERKVADAEYRRQLRGARPEELEMARAEADETDAVYRQVLTQHGRVNEMGKRAFSSVYDRDSAERDLMVAVARKEAAGQKLELLKKGALPEEIERSKHRIEAAAARASAIRSRLSRCEIVAPTDGIVLRVHVEQGELVSELKPSPAISLADTGRMRVRAEVDELDIGQVVVGQRAEIVADAYRGQVWHATVEELARTMGRKSVKSVDPAEKGDRDVLEVVLTLDPGSPPLPIGLRVTVRWNPEPGPAASAGACHPPAPGGAPARVAGTAADQG